MQPKIANACCSLLSLVIEQPTFMEDNAIQGSKHRNISKAACASAWKLRGKRRFETWTQHCPLWSHRENTVDLSELPRNQPVIWIHMRRREGERSSKLGETKTTNHKTHKDGGMNEWAHWERLGQKQKLK